MPSEITPTVEQSNSKLTRLLGARKTGLRLSNAVQMTMSPTTTGSEPRSPDRTRSTKALIVLPSVSACLTRSSLRSSRRAVEICCVSSVIAQAPATDGPGAGWRGARPSFRPHR
ncbi:hypothetical protein ABH978_006038 [Bradyrhizobium ottawaense]